MIPKTAEAVRSIVKITTSLSAGVRFLENPVDCKSLTLWDQLG